MSDDPVPTPEAPGLPALIRYGRHDARCAGQREGAAAYGDCDCGFTAAIHGMQEHRPSCSRIGKPCECQLQGYAAPLAAGGPAGEDAGAARAPQVETAPIPLDEAQKRAAKEWAADDRLWTTQETVEFNLRTFARVVLKVAAQVAAWQPIETAPTDGTQVVLFGSLNDYPGMRACVTRWHAEADAPSYCVGWQFSAPGFASSFNPVYWAPLPAALRAGARDTPEPDNSLSRTQGEWFLTEQRSSHDCYAQEYRLGARWPGVAEHYLGKVYHRQDAEFIVAAANARAERPPLPAPVVPVEEN